MTIWRRLKVIWNSPERIGLLELAKDIGAEPEILTLNRHQLGSIDLSDIPDEPADPEARKNRNAQIAAFFKTIAEPDIKRFVQARLEFIGKEAADWEQSLVGRGTINGMLLLLEKWESAYKQHLADQQQPERESFDPHNPLPEA